MIGIATALATGLKVFATRLIVSMFTEKFVAWLVFYLLGELVKSSKNKVDDEVLKSVEAAYYAK